MFLEFKFVSCFKPVHLFNEYLIAFCDNDMQLSKNRWTKPTAFYTLYGRWSLEVLAKAQTEI